MAVKTIWPIAEIITEALVDTLALKGKGSFKSPYTCKGGERISWAFYRTILHCILRAKVLYVQHSLKYRVEVKEHTGILLLTHMLYLSKKNQTISPAYEKFCHRDFQRGEPETFSVPRIEIIITRCR